MERYDVKDAISVMLHRFSRTDPKYTREYNTALVDGFDEIVDDLYSEKMERAELAKEDVGV